MIPKRETEEMVVDREGRGNRPEAQQGCVEEDFTFPAPHDAIRAFRSGSNCAMGSW
jgi:hypothetical protein